MKQYYFTEITTKDNLVEQGIYFESPHKSDTAILYIHGLTDSFCYHQELFEMITNQTEKIGYGFAAFNNRGHNCITSIHQIDTKSEKGYRYVNGGAGYENFTDCVYDIDAGISFLVSRGYKKVILMGHSTGANKACYYTGTRNDKRIAGVILSSPISDRLIEEKTNLKLTAIIRQMKKMIIEGKDNFLVNNLTFFPITPVRYLSLFERGSVEDVFDYGEKIPRMKYYSRIIVPLLVILSGKDEHSDRPITEIKNVFDTYSKSKNYKSIIIPDATHGYNGKEDEYVKVITDWILPSC
jgi:pimeloyl-ACP methyl ester carboxylesterase